MKRFTFLTAILLCLFISPVCAQSKKKKSAKLPPVRASVSVKIELPPEPTEETAEIWNDFVSDTYGFRLTFPSPADNVTSYEEEKLTHFSASTKKANYSLLVKNLLVSLNNSQLDALYESIIEQTEDPETTKLVSQQDVYLNGFLGKELVYEENGQIVFGRIYVLESKIFMLSVSVAKKDYTTGFNKWARKFLDSFGVRPNANRDT
jgi:hypothetical protein